MNELNVYVLQDTQSSIYHDPYTAANDFDCEIATYESLLAAKVARPFTLVRIGAYHPETGVITAIPHVVVDEFRPPYTVDGFRDLLKMLQMEADYVARF